MVKLRSTGLVRLNRCTASRPWMRAYCSWPFSSTVTCVVFENTSPLLKPMDPGKKEWDEPPITIMTLPQLYLTPFVIPPNSKTSPCERGKQPILLRGMGSLISLSSSHWDFMIVASMSLPAPTTSLSMESRDLSV